MMMGRRKRRRVESHSLGAHVLPVAVGLGGHLGMSHGHLVHLRRGRVGVGQGRAAVGLVRRVGEGAHRATLAGAVELRAHVGTAPGLVGGAEVGTRRVGHLALVARLRVSSTAAALVRITAPTGATTHVVAHITVRRLGGFASQVSGLRTGTQGGLRRRAHLEEADRVLII